MGKLEVDNVIGTGTDLVGWDDIGIVELLGVPVVTVRRGPLAFGWRVAPCEVEVVLEDDLGLDGDRTEDDV